MKISIIVAMTRAGVIGWGSRLPWHLPADLKWFKAQTLSKPVIMGRKTFESLKVPLADRLNIVLSHAEKIQPIAPPFEKKKVLFVKSKEEAMAACGTASECMVIGGASIVSLFLEEASMLYITWVEQAFSGDVFFPSWNPKEWSLCFEERHGPDQSNPCAYTFTKWERIKRGK